MDYIPSPLNAYKPPIDVPLFPDILYDFGTFDGFPTRCGLMNNGQLAIADLDSRKCASFLQAWLYFGLLATFFRARFDVFELSLPSVINHTERLVRIGRFIRQWEDDLAQQLSSLGRAEMMSIIEELDAHLGLATRYLEEFEASRALANPPFSHVLLSIRVLVATIYNTWVNGPTSIYQPLTRTIEPHDVYNVMPMQLDIEVQRISTRFLIGEMREKGWCLNQIFQICRSYDYSTVYYLSLFNRLSPTTKDDLHQDCTPHLCKGNNIDRSYTVMHTSPRCSCHLVGVPEHEILAIIRDGGIPLVSIHRAQHGSLEVRVQPATASSRYIAISHVWSHGLGNPTANSVQLCQAERLLMYVSRLPQPGEMGLYCFERGLVFDWVSEQKMFFPEHTDSSPLFWMDTFCIPLQVHETEKLQAIDKMAATYSRATQTLVLDSELQQLSIGASQHSELFTYMSWCAWMTRAWTLQEGALSRMCYFQFADGAMTPESSSENLVTMPWSGENTLRNILANAWFLLLSAGSERERSRLWKSSPILTNRKLGHDRTEKELHARVKNELQIARKTGMKHDSVGALTEESHLSQFVITWNALRTRSTTESKDIYAIIANLLDFNSSQIQQLPCGTRLQAMLWSSRSVPFSLLYNSGPRLRSNKAHKGRWIPTEIRGSILSQEPKMTFIEEGLLLDTASDASPDIFLLGARIVPYYFFMRDRSSGEGFFISALREPEDAIDEETFEATCIALNKHNERSQRCQNLKGASFLVSRFDTENDPSRSPVLGHPLGTNPQFSAAVTFDCPLRIWPIDELGRIPASEESAYKSKYPNDQCPTFECYKVRNRPKLVIECDDPIINLPYPRRPFPSYPKYRFLDWIVPVPILIIFRLLPLVLLIVEITQSHVHISKLEITGFISVFSSFLVIPIGFFLWYLGIGLYVAGRLMSHGFTALTKVFLALAAIPAMLPILLWDKLWKKAVYEIWLRTFDEDWTEEKESGFWAKMFMLDAKMKALHPKLMSRFRSDLDRAMQNSLDWLSSKVWLRRYGPSLLGDYQERRQKSRELVAIVEETRRKNMPHDLGIIEKVRAETQRRRALSQDARNI